MVIKFMIWVFAFILLLVLATFFVDSIIKAPAYKGPKSGHFNGTTFVNPDGVKARGFLDILKWSLTSDPGEWKELTEEDVEPGSVPETVAANGEIAVTFVNHATFLIQTADMNILTDPIWSLRASPFQWIGPKRMRPPGIRFEDLPQIDAVLISHNHYDHLDIGTLKRLEKVHQPIFIVPLGVSEYLNENGITDAFELDWWSDHKLTPAITVAGVPAQHFSGRGLTDRDKTLWCGYVLQTPSGNIYFAGDTGYDGFFKEIGRRYAPIDLALIPIGAYRPRWFMAPIHVNPEEAVLIHKDLKAKYSIGMHFGTFPLGDDGMTEPVQDLTKARAKYHVPEEAFRTLKEGETFKPDLITITKKQPVQ